MRDWFWVLRNLLWVVFVTCSALDTQAAGSRIALVIGNSTYKHAPPLTNPIHDATDVAGALERLGFEVVRGIDLDYGSMREHMLRFTNKLADAEVVLFYYAGHALQVAGRNYLIPVDAKIESEYDLDLLAVDLDLVLRSMARGTRTTLVFLDACRDNPFIARLARRVGGRSIAVNRGLAPVASGIGSLIVFATEPGSVALDGEGRNSPFTAALLQNIQRPGMQITDMMVAVRKEVLRLTDGQQVPWEHSSLVGKFFFVPQSMSAPESGAEDATRQRQIDSRDLEIAFWNSIKNGKSSRLFEAYLNRYPDGIFADLAKINIEELRTAVDKLPVDQPDDKTLINDDILLAEIRDRLYELNYDPGPINGPMGDAAYQAIREFQISRKMPLTGEATNGLLRRLREIGGRKPWGTIVYAKGSDKWGISWGHASRKEAVASARASCGNPDQCFVELSFFGLDCGAFAYSVGAYALVARDSLQQAKAAALADCNARANHCRIIASVCATGEGAAIR